MNEQSPPIKVTLMLRESAVEVEFVPNLRRDDNNMYNMQSAMWKAIRKALLAMPEIAQVRERWENIDPVVLTNWPTEDD